MSTASNPARGDTENAVRRHESDDEIPAGRHVEVFFAPLERLLAT